MHCFECGSPHTLPVDASCPSCGEVVGVACRDCGNLFDVAEIDGGVCGDCSESRKRVAAKDRAHALWESHGDWLRDQRKDEP